MTADESQPEKKITKKDVDEAAAAAEEAIAKLRERTKKAEDQARDMKKLDEEGR